MTLPYEFDRYACGCGGTVYAQVSEACGRKPLEVQVLSSAPNNSRRQRAKHDTIETKYIRRLFRVFPHISKRLRVQSLFRVAKSSFTIEVLIQQDFLFCFYFLFSFASTVKKFSLKRKIASFCS